MDHIPDEDGIRLAFKVPYLCQDIHYDGQDWHTFPERYGYPWLSFHYLTVHGIEQHQADHTQLDLQAFAQAWLYFGVLEALLGQRYRHVDFIEQDSDGHWWISTRAALQWNFKWKQRLIVPWLITLNQAPKGYFGSAVLLGQAIEASNVWDQYSKGRDRSWAELVLSIKLLVELLASIPLYYGVKAIADKSFAAQPGPALDILRQYLLQRKGTWCVHQVDSLSTQVSYSTLLYVTGIGRYERPGVDHTQCLARASCNQYSIGSNTQFRTAHLATHCRCEHVEAPSAERRRILRRGGIPVVSCTTDDSGSIILRYVPASPSLKYVAISHLWADGLGNPVGNSLPYCQILQIVQFIQQANRNQARRPLTDRLGLAKGSTHVLFWLDVYCVPLGRFPNGARDPRAQEEQELDMSLKLKAIARMDATYTWAQYVLAIDQETARLATNETLDKTHALIGISAWNMRCWTYQEHCLAKFTIFQGFNWQYKREKYNLRRKFEDLDFSPIIQLSQDLRKLSDSPILISSHQFHRDRKELNTWINPAPNPTRESPDEPNKFLQAWNAFHGRTTSQWDDMIVILANLLDLDATSILLLDRGFHMKAVLAAQRQLPLALLFADLRRLPHTNEGGTISYSERWVPAALQNVYLPQRLAKHDMEVIPEGLLLKKARVRSEVVLLRLEYLPISEEPTIFRWRPEHMEEECDFWLALDLDKARETQADKNASHLKNVFLLLDRSHPLLGRDHLASFHGACLLQTGRTESGYVSIAFVCPVRWGTLSDIEVPQESSAEAGPSEQILPLPKDSRPKNKIVARLITPKHPQLLISSDIASWPTLRSRRRRLSFIIYVGFGNMLFITLPIFLALVFIMVLPYSTRQPRQALSIFTYVLLAVAFCLRLLEPALRYQLMYSTQSELDVQQIWWRQLDTIFRMLRWRDLRLVDWVFMPVVWVLVKGIKVVEEGVNGPLKRWIGVL